MRAGGHVEEWGSRCWQLLSCSLHVTRAIAHFLQLPMGARPASPPWRPGPPAAFLAAISERLSRGLPFGPFTAALPPWTTAELAALSGPPGEGDARVLEIVLLVGPSCTGEGPTSEREGE